MQMIYKSILLSASLVFGLYAHAAESAFKLPNYERITLDNGLTIFLMEQHEVPLIDVSVVVKTGAINDELAGTAMLSADSLLLGTKPLSREEFEQKLDFVGADISSKAQLESSYISASMASKDKDLVLELVRDAALYPAFHEDEFANMKTRYLAMLERQNESPKAKVKSYFDALLYQDHPYANNVSGTPSSVNIIGLDEVKAFHLKWYTPSNSAVIVTGDFESKQMKKQLSSLFGAWKGIETKQKQLRAPVEPKHSKVLLVNKGDAKESTFMVGGPGIEQSNPDYVALSVINTVLGGRFTSWLNDELRVNTGLTYGARSRFDANRLRGSFYISTFTKTPTTNEAIDLAISTYQRLWDKGIDEETLSSAKAYVKGQFPPRYETSSDLANLLSQMFIYDFDESYINTFNKKVNALNVKNIRPLVNKYFPRDKLQFVVIGEAEALRSKLSQYGELQEVNINDDSTKL